MVICLKVKTLDSQTYDFSVDNEISVRQFKETIAERTSISADLQRIIYCGRVLADEKLLKEYDVNGKVVHVVERPPPSARSTSNTGHATNRRQRGDGIEGNIRGAPIFRALDGLVVGAMTIPVNPNGGTPPTAAHLNPSSSFCMNRITVARHMLECANNIASYLENPERGLNNSSLDILTQGRWTMESTVVEVGISAASNVELPQNQTQNIVEALHGAVSAALRQNGHPNVTVLQLPTVFGSNGSTVMTAPQGQELTTDQFLNIISRQPQHENETQNASTPEVVGTPNTTTTGSTNQNQQQQQQSQQSQQPPQPPQPQQPQPQPQQQQERSRIGTPVGGNSNSESPTSGRQRTGTRVLAEVVQQMRAVQTRLEPFYQQYYEILLNDPAFPENDNTGRENAQRIYDRISEALHYLSHAQHAISDLMLDMSQNTPRFLCCRPILVEQSGYVSSNNYLASFLQPNGNNNETTATNNNPMMINLTPPPLINANDNSPLLLNNDSNIIMAGRPFGRMTIPMEPTPQEEQNEQQQQQQQTNPSNNGQQQQTTESNLDNDIDIPQTPTTTPVQSQIPTTLSGPGGQLTASSQEQQQQQANSQLQVARLIQAVVNSAPVDADVHVQINAPNLLFGMPVRTSTPSSIQDGSGTTTSTTTTTTTTLNTSTSQTTNSNANTTNSTANSTASEITDSNQQQPRFTTATHPTTSTQTRSTARPQVHVANLPPSQMWNARVIPANMLSSFDRFLPCSSHHIRDTELSDVNNSGQHNQNIFTRTRNHQMRVQRNNRNQQQPGSIVVNSPGIIIGAPTILTASTTAGPAESSTASTPRSTTTTQPTSSTRSNSSSDDIFNLSTEDFNTPINLFGSNLTLRDLIDITPSPNTLNRIRSELYAFIVENLFAGTEINEENMNNAINQVIQLLNNALVFLPQFDLPDYDARASVENFLRNTLPFIINLIREDDSNEFGTRLLRELINFVRRLFVILITCVGRSNAELYINQIAQMTITSNNALEQEALRALQRHLMAAVIRQLDLTRQNTIEVQEFLVVRRPSPEQSQTTNAITPMETDDIVADEPIESMAISNETSSLQQRNQDQNLPIPAPISDVNEPLPSVVVGSESWHNNFPSTWLPIITRDIERQRRQSPQGSFSDAYISGMSAKRRKLITNSKPPTDVTSLLSDGVRIALQTVNGSSNSAIGGGIISNNTNGITFDEVSAAISSDPMAQTSYREALKTNLQERLKTDPDFKSDKFPNSSKYLNK